MYKVVLILALSISALTACTDNKPINPINVLQVSDFDFTMNKKQAASISFGETSKKFCTATIYRESVQSGYSVQSVRNSSKDLSMDCNWDGKYYIESSKHTTSASFKIDSLDQVNQTATLSVSLKLVEPSSEKYLKMKDVILVLDNQMFDNLVKKI